MKKIYRRTTHKINVEFKKWYRSWEWGLMPAYYPSTLKVGAGRWHWHCRGQPVLTLWVLGQSRLQGATLSQKIRKKRKKMEGGSIFPLCWTSITVIAFCLLCFASWYHPCLGLKPPSWNHHHFCIHCMAIKLFLTSNFGLGGSLQRNERWETPMFQTSCSGFHCPNCSN